MIRTADFRDTDMNGVDDRDQPNFSGPSQNYLDQQERARNLLNPNLNQQVGNNPPQMPIQPIRRNPSPFGNNLSMGRFGGYNQPQPFMGGYGMPQMGYGGGFGYGMPQMGYGMQQMPFMGGFGGYGGGFGGGFGMQQRMPQMGYGGFGGFGMPQMGGYGSPFGQSFYGGLGSFMGQPSFQQPQDSIRPAISHDPTRPPLRPRPAIASLESAGPSRQNFGSLRQDMQPHIAIPLQRQVMQMRPQPAQEIRASQNMNTQTRNTDFGPVTISSPAFSGQL